MLWSGFGFITIHSGVFLIYMNGGRKDFFLNWHIFFSNFATRQLDPGMVIL